jgi:hypothetical protein
VDAIGGYDDIGFRGRASGEGNANCVAMLFKTSAAMSGVYRAHRQGIGQHPDKVGAVYSERRIPTRRVGHLHRGDWRPVMPEVVRIGANPSAALRYRRRQSHPL